MPKYAVKVTIWSDDPIPSEDIAPYVVNAVRFWGGQGDPDGPLFPTNMSRVRAESRGYYSDTEEEDEG